MFKQEKKRATVKWNGDRRRPDEGNVLDGAAGLGEARSGLFLCARHVVRPAAETRASVCGSRERGAL